MLASGTSHRYCTMEPPTSEESAPDSVSPSARVAAVRLRGDTSSTAIGGVLSLSENVVA
jgi:hypothetical protein